ncbi:alpha/beta fold hydrolase [Nocardioides ungokensis]|uniref:alpha/beta fold hydrolase n=1 Tax=Nocardioides ungokensis TaxID=1643322 RepID=UPI0015DF4358|nr:alpha/beta fold hydrolase [Nocardioides ungokensis]
MRTRTVLAAVAGLVSTAMVAGVPATTSAQATERAPAAAQFTPRAISWHKCTDRDLRHAHAQCGMLVVPLDHADPASPTIRLAVSRVRHTRGPYRGIVVTNPGGPGASGTSLATLGQSVPGHVAQTYDWYGLDPRGVGASRPALSCDGGYFGWDRPSYVPHNRSISSYWRRTTENYAADCGSAAASELLPHLRTTDNARDFDILRRTVGANKWTFYGFSYGTYLAQVYANLYPNRVKAMVLDGVLDPTRVFYRSNLDQDRAFQVTNDKFFAWVGKYPGIYHLGHGRKAVQRGYDRLRHRLERHAAGGKVGPDELADALLLASYYRPYYTLVAPAWSALANHNRPGGIARLYRALNPAGPGADNGYAVYVATECTDAPWPQDWATWRQDNWRVHHQAPFYTWANAWYNAPCRTWPAASGPRFDVTGRGVKAPILLTNETYDPATPFPGALTVRSIFPTSALVEGVGGTSHAVSLSGIACTDNAVAALLRDGSLPKRRAGHHADKRCPGLPAPAPRAAGRPVAHRPLPVPVRW